MNILAHLKPPSPNGDCLVAGWRLFSTQTVLNSVHPGRRVYEFECNGIVCISADNIRGNYIVIRCRWPCDVRRENDGKFWIYRGGGSTVVAYRRETRRGQRDYARSPEWDDRRRRRAAVIKIQGSPGGGGGGSSACATFVSRDQNYTTRPRILLVNFRPFFPVAGSGGGAGAGAGGYRAAAVDRGRP